MKWKVSLDGLTYIQTDSQSRIVCPKLCRLHKDIKQMSDEEVNQGKWKFYLKLETSQMAYYIIILQRYEPGKCGVEQTHRDEHKY